MKKHVPKSTKLKYKIRKILNLKYDNVKLLKVPVMIKKFSHD